MPHTSLFFFGVGGEGLWKNISVCFFHLKRQMNFILAADCGGDAGGFPTQGQQAAGWKRPPSGSRLIYRRVSNDQRV